MDHHPIEEPDRGPNLAYSCAMECCVRFLPSEREIRVPAGTSLLEAARRAGLPVASACGADGICARCGLDILEAQTEGHAVDRS